jgi:hypothetical protein
MKLRSILLIVTFSLSGAGSVPVLLEGTDAGRAVDTGCRESAKAYDFFAQTALSDCPIPEKVRNICLYFTTGEKDPKPLHPRYRFLYQRQLLEAACVSPTEAGDDEIVSQKMSHMWEQLNRLLVCSGANFEVHNGSLLKYGVGATADPGPFVSSIIRWKINLNIPDPADDNRTLLDYLQSQINRNRNTSLGPILQRYYDRLRAAGGKHKSELDKEAKQVTDPKTASSRKPQN